MKYLLEFGDVAHCLGYAALKDYFNNQPLKPNPCCLDSFCRKRQAEFKSGKRCSILEKLKKEEVIEEEKEIENPFGIEMESEDENEVHVPPEQVTKVEEKVEVKAEVKSDGVSLDDLMNQLDNL